MDYFNKSLDMFSETKRAADNRLLVNTIRSRRGERSEENPTPIISIQQRLSRKRCNYLSLKQPGR